MRLLTRTTRSESPTDVGEQLLSELRPALSDIRGVLTTLSGFSPRPSDGYGSCVPASPRGPSSDRSWGSWCATTRGLNSRLPPTIPGSISCRPATMRIQFGEYIAQDMVAVRVSPDLRPAVVGAPAYFESHPKPASPRDVLNHRCIRFRAPRREYLQMGTRQGRRVAHDRRQWVAPAR